MVYCTRCGTKNEEDAVMCVKCRASLVGHPPWRREHRPEEECFGLPHGGVIAGLVIGIAIILVGIASLLGIEFWNYLWPLIIIIIGVLITSGALYKYSRRY